MATREATASKFLELETEIALRDSRIDQMMMQIQSMASVIRATPQVAPGDSGLPETYQVGTPGAHTPPIATAPPPPHRGIFAACSVPHQGVHPAFANVETVLAIELLASCQALEFHRPRTTTKPLEAYSSVRALI